MQPLRHHRADAHLTGSAPEDVLEEQWQPSTTRILRVSSTCHTWPPSAPAGDTVSELRIDGVPVARAAHHRVPVSSSPPIRGAGFTATTDAVGEPVDLDALLAHLPADPGTAPARDRIAVLS